MTRTVDLAVSISTSMVHEMLQRKWLTCIIQQYIFWFQVSVDDPMLVKVLQPTDDLSCIETCSFLIKTRVFFIHIVHMKPARGRMIIYTYIQYFRKLLLI